jgi:ABC-type uncharacterized transport system ATPase subunit
VTKAIRAPYIKTEAITKRFGSLVANDSISLDIKPGEVHALLGENGAGKTTLMKILYGLYQPTEGRLLLDGAPVTFRSPHDALSHGIGMIHQHFMLVPRMSVAENFAIGQGAWLKTWSRADFERRVRDASEAVGLPIDPIAIVADLSVGAQQRVEIVRALSRGARVLILDEPTAVLTPQEAQGLISALRQMAGNGTSIIYISHKMPEVMAVSDRISILRAGRLVSSATTSACDEAGLARAMLGRHDETATSESISSANAGEVRMTVRNLRVVDDRGHVAINDLSFDLRAGEVLGVAGVDGNGQSELSQVLAGLRRAALGSVEVDGINLVNQPPRKILEAGIGIVTDDRQVWGLFPDLSIAENIVAESYGKPPFSRRGVLDHRAINDTAKRLMTEFDIRPPIPSLPVGTLSGGNKQKVIIARAFAKRPKVVIISQPTRGVDVGASRAIRARIRAESQRGAAVLVISADLDEIESVSDRIAVMYEGHFIQTLQKADATIERLGLLMAGVNSETKECLAN